MVYYTMFNKPHLYILILKAILVIVLIIVAFFAAPILNSSEYTHFKHALEWNYFIGVCLLYTSPSPRDATLSRMPSSA